MIYKIVGFFLALAGVAMFVAMRGADLAYHSNAWEISERAGGPIPLEDPAEHRE